MLINQLSALSHSQRMAIFQLLVRRCPDALSAGEIANTLNLKASTASVYLSTLTKAGLIAYSRQGTFLHYHLKADTVQGMISDLFQGCCRGRPDLCPPLNGEQSEGRKFNVLFICTGNSARSIFAESILRHEASDRFHVYSAGINARSQLNCRALEILRNKGIDTGVLRAKSVNEYRTADAPKMDFVFTVCDHAANEECPTWPGQPISAHWGVPDPASATGNDAEKRIAFQQAFGAIQNRIRAFAALPLNTMDRLSLQHHMDDIARQQELT